MTKRQFREKEENRKAVNERTMNQLATIQSQDSKCKIVKQYFERNAIRTFAVYGRGITGEEFMRICSKCYLKPTYFIDKFISGNVEGIPVYQVRFDFLPE